MSFGETFKYNVRTITIFLSSLKAMQSYKTNGSPFDQQFLYANFAQEHKVMRKYVQRRFLLVTYARTL